MSLVVHRLREVGSTQDEARRLLESGRASPGHVFVADEQSEGRGRFGREWLSPAGGLYATFLVKRCPSIALVSGVAVIRALARFDVAACLKWPNDLLVGEKKLAGILIETTRHVALVGVGVNLLDAPLQTATCVRAAGGTARRGELVVAIGEELRKPRDVRGLLTAYRGCLSTLGRVVRIALANGGTIEGTAVDIDADGRLLIETEMGRRTVSSGECVHLRV